MKLDLTEIAHSLGMHYTYEVDDKDPALSEPGWALNEPVRGKVEFSNTGQLLLARGVLTTVVRLECSRCLASFPLKQMVKIEEHFAIHPDQILGQPYEEDEEDSEDATADELQEYYKDYILDLTELIRQNLIVELPLAPLCKEDCRGLCLHCGRNLNEEQCDCTPTVEGPFVVLKDILKSMEGAG